jgi:hypothetical protein
LARGNTDPHNGVVWNDIEPPDFREVSSTMKLIGRARQRRLINRQNRAIDRAWQSATTQAMRDEIAFFAQRQPV